MRARRAACFVGLAAPFLFMFFIHSLLPVPFIQSTGGQQFKTANGVGLSSCTNVQDAALQGPHPKGDLLTRLTEKRVCLWWICSAVQWSDEGSEERSRTAGRAAVSGRWGAEVIGR